MGQKEGKILLFVLIALAVIVLFFVGWQVCQRYSGFLFSLEEEKNLGPGGEGQLEELDTLRSQTDAKSLSRDEESRQLQGLDTLRGEAQQGLNAKSLAEQLSELDNLMQAGQ